jgi:hypothetical protein
MAILGDLIQMLLELGHGLVYTRAGRTMTSLGGGALHDNFPVYEHDFEEVFLGESQNFYRAESASRLSHPQAMMWPGSSPSILGASVPGDAEVTSNAPRAD